MKALDIAVFLFSLNIAIYIVGQSSGWLIPASTPSPLISLSDLQQIFIYSNGDTAIAVIQKIATWILTTVILTLIAYRILGLDFGSTLIFALTIGIGLFVIGKILFYALALGDSINGILKVATKGLVSLPPSVIWGINSIYYITIAIAIVDYIRGTSTRMEG